MSVLRGVITRGKTQLRMAPRVTGTSNRAADMKRIVSTAVYTHQSKKKSTPCERIR